MPRPVARCIYSLPPPRGKCNLRFPRKRKSRSTGEGNRTKITLHDFSETVSMRMSFRYILVHPFLCLRNSSRTDVPKASRLKQPDSTFFPIHFDTLINSNYFRRIDNLILAVHYYTSSLDHVPGILPVKVHKKRINTKRIKKRIQRGRRTYHFQRHPTEIIPWLLCSVVKMCRPRAGCPPAILYSAYSSLIKSEYPNGYPLIAFDTKTIADDYRRAG